jgi:hypothetical protein
MDVLDQRRIFTTRTNVRGNTGWGGEICYISNCLADGTLSSITLLIDEVY